MCDNKKEPKYSNYLGKPPEVTFESYFNKLHQKRIFFIQITFYFFLNLINHSYSLIPTEDGWYCS